MPECVYRHVKEKCEKLFFKYLQIAMRYDELSVGLDLVCMALRVRAFPFRKSHFIRGTAHAWRQHSVESTSKCDEMILSSRMVTFVSFGFCFQP